MKFKIALFLLISAPFCQAQLGMGNNTTPNSSAVLDLSSTNKGLLTPRLTNAQRDAILSPALGLLIYNTDDNDFNSYNGEQLGWQDFATGYTSVESNSQIFNSSIVDQIATGMSVTPEKGTYSVMFNSEFENTDTIITLPATRISLLDSLTEIIANLDDYFIIGTPEYNSIGHTHYASYIDNVGQGSLISNNLLTTYYTFDKLTIYPGAYNESAAINFVGDGEVTFDGLGNPNAKFIIRAGAAINTAIGVKFKLVNGAKANNIFWLATGAMGIGATNEMKGNCITRYGAIAIGIGSNLDGRLLTSIGALTMGNGNLSIPNETSFIDFKSLVSFLAFTGGGDINVTGDVSTETNLKGDLFTCEAFNNFGFQSPYGTGNAEADIQPIIGPPVRLVGKLYRCLGPEIIPGEIIINNFESFGTFSLYKNNILIPYTAKTVVSNKNSDIITLQTIATVDGTDIIDVRWKTAAGNTVLMGNRNLTFLKVQ